MTVVPPDERLLPGFASPVFDSQVAFRALMQAIAYPGRIVEIGAILRAPEPLDSSTAAVCLTLLDTDTPVWLDDEAARVSAYLRFHSGIRIALHVDVARFLVIADPTSMPRLAACDPGTDFDPDRSATLIVQLPSLTGGDPRTWTGPGINGSIVSRVDGLPAWFWADWEVNRRSYPMGCDVIFTSGNALVGMPRGVKVER
jgi:alpha-D-ribose 1-methylphosphonate 5-triphosphate synthase subunit PhnH